MARKVVYEEEETIVNNAVPYPEAPPVDHANPKQEHYRGARNSTMGIKKEEKESSYRRPFGPPMKGDDDG